MTEIVIGSLFSGYGGLDLGVEAALLAAGATSVRVAWVSDIDPGARKILAHRYPGVPNLGDITRVDWRAVEPVDVLTGGFPCQDVSGAGLRAGLRPGTRSGLWSQMAYAVSILRPRLMVAENVRGLLSAGASSDVEPCPWCLGDPDAEPPVRALGAVLGDLADLGHDARWVGLRAADVGAPHNRFRVFVGAWPVAAPDPDGATRGERGVAAPGQAEGGRARADARGRGRVASPDTVHHEWEEHEDDAGVDRQRAADGRVGAIGTAGTRGDRVAHGRDVSVAHAAAGGPESEGSRGGRAPLAHAGSERHGGGEDAGSVGCVGREDEGAAWEWERARGVAGDRGAEAAGLSVERRVDAEPAAQWGPYGPAVERWAHVVRRPAPAPAIGGRLSPRFVEWMMGLPDGWVTDVPGLKRNDMLKALGNGVVPQQAAAAVRVLLEERAS